MVDAVSIPSRYGKFEKIQVNFDFLFIFGKVLFFVVIFLIFKQRDMIKRIYTTEELSRENIIGVKKEKQQRSFNSTIGAPVIPI